MFTSRMWTALLGCAALGLASPATAAVEYGSTVIATGLNNPRDLAFGPDGGLYVVESGVAQISPQSVIVLRNGVPQTFYSPTRAPSPASLAASSNGSSRACRPSVP